MALQRSNPGRISNESTIKGIGTNPGLILDSTNYPGTNCRTVTDSDYTDKKFLGGEATAGFGGGISLLRTDVFQPGTLRDNMLITTTFFTDYSDGATDIVADSQVLKLVIYKLDPEDNQILRTSTFKILFTSEDMGMMSGLTPIPDTNNTYHTQWLNFDPRYAYRIEVFTADVLESNQGIILDYIYLQYQPKNGISIPNQTASPIGTESVNCTEGVLIAITTSAGGTGNAGVEPRTTESYSSVYNIMNGAYSGIIGATFSPAQFYGNGDVYSVTVQDSLLVTGAKRITVSCDTVGGATTVYGTLVITGIMTPREV